MGFPIRKSSDQRVFAPPRRLSQRITSFIACACQGIHQLPLRHLIVLIANVHLRRSSRIALTPSAQKDQLLEIGPEAAVRQACHGPGIERSRRRSASFSTRPPRKVIDLPGPGSGDGTRTNLLFTISDRTGGEHGRSPQTFHLANDPKPDRHPDPLDTDGKAILVEPDGIEPTTPCLQSRCSPS